MRSFLTAALNPLCIGLGYGPKFLDPPPKWPDCGERTISLCLTSRFTHTAYSKWDFDFYFVPCHPYYDPSNPSRWDTVKDYVMFCCSSSDEDNLTDFGYVSAQLSRYSCSESAELLKYPHRVVGLGYRVTPLMAANDAERSFTPYKYEVLFDDPNASGSYRVNRALWLHNADFLDFVPWWVHNWGLYPWPYSGVTSRSNSSVYVRSVPDQYSRRFYNKDRWFEKPSEIIATGENDHCFTRYPILHMNRCQDLDYFIQHDAFEVEVAWHFEVQPSYSWCSSVDLCPPNYSFGSLCYFLNSYGPILRHVKDLYPRHDLSSGSRVVL